MKDHLQFIVQCTCIGVIKRKVWYISTELQQLYDIYSVCFTMSMCSVRIVLQIYK